MNGLWNSRRSPIYAKNGMVACSQVSGVSLQLAWYWIEKCIFFTTQAVSSWSWSFNLEKRRKCSWCCCGSRCCFKRDATDVYRYKKINYVFTEIICFCLTNFIVKIGKDIRHLRIYIWRSGWRCICTVFRCSQKGSSRYKWKVFLLRLTLKA